MKEFENELLEVREKATEGTVIISLARYEELIKKEYMIEIMKMGMFYLSEDAKKFLGVKEGEK